MANYFKSHKFIPATPAEIELEQQVQERRETKSRLSSMMNELHTRDWKSWQEMDEFAKYHTLGETFDTVNHELERLDGIDAAQEQAELRAAL